MNKNVSNILLKTKLNTELAQGGTVDLDIFLDPSCQFTQLAIKNLSNGINYINNKQMNFIYKIVKDKIPYDKIIKEYKRCFKGGNKK